VLKRLIFAVRRMLTMPQQDALLTSIDNRSRKIERIADLVRVALRHDDCSPNQLQCVHENGGKFQRELRSFLRTFAQRHGAERTIEVYTDFERSLEKRITECQKTKTPFRYCVLHS
jgi:hypothetical protein